MRHLPLLGALAALATALVCAVPAAASLPAGVMTPAEVIAIDRALDGSTIETQGEAIGERLRAHGGGYWINILHEGSAIGIWVPVGLADVVSIFGDYHQNGDIVRVTGVVNVACDTHGGEFDVHASSIAVVEPGGPRDNPVQLWKGVIGLAGLVVASLAWRAHRQRRERRMI
jgi:hypothetical protein